MSVERDLETLAERWAAAGVGERANAQLYITEFCDALGVPRPMPKGSGYEFEFPIKVVEADGTETTKPADLFRKDHFLLEAKDIEMGKSDEALLRKAYGQVRGYVTHLPGPAPPYLLVLDVARAMLVWNRWEGTYGGFAATKRIDLQRLHERPDDITLLQDIWTRPEIRNPRRTANAVTKDIAEHLGELAASLEDRGHSQEEVARFLIRCVFTMFAEDVGLLKGQPFLEAVREVGLKDPDEFAPAVERLWMAMDQGKDFGVRKLLRFNGHFFRDRSVLPLTKEDLVVLLEAAEADWGFVEPSIFGTLFTRALDPADRHRLGAEFTPREFVERVVRPTIEEPVRERWRSVEASVFQLREGKRKKDLKEAEKQLLEFHRWLVSLQILDPACGSGNFLYVALAGLKRIEAEVIETLEELTGKRDILLDEVGPAQFHGIEVRPWAREIAELTLWIGYHQFWQEHHGHVRPREPVLTDTGTLQCRDAVLSWDDVIERPAKAQRDTTLRIKHPVTGRLVPDAKATVPYLEHMNPRRAEWPPADFIIGNPPYMGVARQRREFGDGYIEALRTAYSELPDTVDYVMYWWHRAASLVIEGKVIRAGLITTNTITQSQNRKVVAAAYDKGASVIWAVPDHPWIDEKGAADVRVAMTVIAQPSNRATLVEVDERGEVKHRVEVKKLNPDLSVDVDTSGAANEPLLANKGLSFRGVVLIGEGFVIDAEEATELLIADEKHRDIIRPLRNGRDLTQGTRGLFVIDFGMRKEEEARDYPILYDIIRDRVKPMRDANRRAYRRDYWWRFGEPQPAFREASRNIERYIATPMTAKHRFFVFLPAGVVSDQGIISIASSDAFILGVLSTTIHVTWALIAGGRLGVGNDPRYNNTLCFDPFPFPLPDPDLRTTIGALAEKLDNHRWEAIRNHQEVRMTLIYNVVEKLRSGEQLTDREREVHKLAACGIIRDMHNELDDLVAKAYGWKWPLAPIELLARLVELHGARLAEEREGEIRWLVPEYQVPRFAPEEPEVRELHLPKTEMIAPLPVWPTGDAIGQISGIKAALDLAPGTAAEITGRYQNAERKLVKRHLATLLLLGEARQSDDGKFYAVEEPVVL